MISSIFGIAVIALPSGIITAGLMEQILKQKSDEAANPGEKQYSEIRDMSFNHRTPDIRLTPVDAPEQPEQNQPEGENKL